VPANTSEILGLKAFDAAAAAADGGLRLLQPLFERLQARLVGLLHLADLLADRGKLLVVGGLCCRRNEGGRQCGRQNSFFDHKTGPVQRERRAAHPGATGGPAVRKRLL
jgi:hypothetical protein